MDYRVLSIGFVLGAACALTTHHALSQQDDNDGDDAFELQDESDMMEAWMEAMEPGPNHELMNRLIGEWETTTRMWVQGPEGEPIETHGTSTRRWVLGDRFVFEETTGEFPLAELSGGQAENMPWNGMGFFGYDGFRNMYVGCWVESMGTQMLTMKGSVSEDGNTFTYYGEMDEPMLGVIGRMVKYQTRIVDDNSHVFSIYDLHAGDDYRVVEITYTRRNAADDAGN